MGDILHALPAVTALRNAHPGWVIDWVVEPRWRALLDAEEGATDANLPSAQRPVINQLYAAATKEWRKTPFTAKTISEIKSLRRSLRAGEYDAVLDLQGAIRSAVVGRMAGCRRLIGEAAPRERVAGWLFTERVATKGAHVIEQDVELASAVAGDELQPSNPSLPIDPVAEAWAGEFLATGEGRPTILINPGAGWGAKRWPTERYAAVAMGLIERGCRVVVNAGPGEELLAEAVSLNTGGAADPLLCRLEQLIALTRRAALVIAGDTGPLHLACALRRPVVGIYGPTDPSRNGPYGTRFKVLRSPESRRDHSRREQPEAGLLTIQPDDVLDAVDELRAEEGLR
jgi:heptosyltransferase-1